MANPKKTMTTDTTATAGEHPAVDSATREVPTASDKAADRAALKAGSTPDAQAIDPNAQYDVQLVKVVDYFGTKVGPGHTVAAKGSVVIQWGDAVGSAERKDMTPPEPDPLGQNEETQRHLRPARPIDVTEGF